MNNNVGNVIKEQWNRLQGYSKQDKSPKNAAPVLLLLFCNLVFLMLDGVTAYTIYQFTLVPAYGVIAFLAGCVPLWMAEYGYWSPYANGFQKWMSGISAVLALVEILWCAWLSAQIQAGLDVTAYKTDKTLLMDIIILVSVAQAILAGLYAYADDEIRRKQELNRGVASIEILEKMGRAVEDALAVEGRVREQEKKLGQNPP